MYALIYMEKKRTNEYNINQSKSSSPHQFPFANRRNLLDIKTSIFRPERNYPARQNRPVLQTAVERRSRGFNRRTQIPGIAITITPTLTIIYRGGRWATSRLCPLQMTRHRRNSGVPLCLSLSLLPSRAPSLIKASKLRKRPPLSFERKREREGGQPPSPPRIPWKDQETRRRELDVINVT